MDKNQIFYCYTGLSYIDINELKESNLRVAFDNNYWIMTARKKTNVSSNVRLLDIPMAIIEKYKGKQKDGKLLPILSNQKMNAYLKEIADICKINKALTFHMARHRIYSFRLKKSRLQNDFCGQVTI